MPGGNKRPRIFFICVSKSTILLLGSCIWKVTGGSDCNGNLLQRNLSSIKVVDFKIALKPSYSLHAGTALCPGARGAGDVAEEMVVKLFIRLIMPSPPSPKILRSNYIKMSLRGKLT